VAVVAVVQVRHLEMVVLDLRIQAVVVVVADGQLQVRHMQRLVEQEDRA
jgi:hypothetical protein